MTYVRLKSWHVVGQTLALGVVVTRCGRSARVLGHLPPGGEVSPTADHLPLGDRSCETCLRLTAHDEDAQNVSDDEVPT